MGHVTSLIEMSRQFDSPVGTIKRRLHMARKRLAKQLKADYVVVGSLMMMPQIYTSPSAPWMLTGYYVVLAVPLLMVFTSSFAPGSRS